MTKLKLCQKSKKNFFSLRVRVVRAPLVDSQVLNDILAQRQKAVVL
ncbi:MAG: hypothetical protein Q7R92_03360 [bacterium]|nr:hypothetical protein [bacterium]